MAWSSPWAGSRRPATSPSGCPSAARSSGGRGAADPSGRSRLRSPVSGPARKLDERPQPGGDLRPCSAEGLQRALLRAFDLGRIIEAPVQRIVVAGEDGAGLASAIAHGDYVVERLADEVRCGFAACAGPIDADLRSE